MPVCGLRHFNRQPQLFVLSVDADSVFVARFEVDFRSKIGAASTPFLSCLSLQRLPYCAALPEATSLRVIPLQCLWLPLCGVCRHSCGFSLYFGGRLERPTLPPPLLVCLRPFAAGSTRWRSAALKQTRTIGPHPAGFRPATGWAPLLGFRLFAALLPYRACPAFPPSIPACRSLFRPAASETRLCF